MAEIDDIEAIKQLKARYFRFLDTKQWPEFVDVFTPDVSTEVAEANITMTGAEEFVAFVSAAMADAVTTHHGHMPEITLTSDSTATGIWAMFDDVDLPRGIQGVPGVPEGPSRMRGSGHYHERYVKGQDGRWRIAALRLTRLRTEWSPRA